MTTSVTVSVNPYFSHDHYANKFSDLNYFFHDELTYGAEAAFHLPSPLMPSLLSAPYQVETTVEAIKCRRFNSVAPFLCEFITN